MNFEGDVFISSAHLDNIGLVEGHKGWVANLHRALEIRVAQLMGKQSRIWWDPKLRGNDVFAETLIDRLRRVAALVSVVSPRYVKSEWGRKELADLRPALRVPVTLLVGALLYYGFFPQSFVRMVAPAFRTYLTANKQP